MRLLRNITLLTFSITHGLNSSMFYVLTLLFNSQVIMNFAWKFFSKSKLPSRPECQCLIPVFPLSAETCLFPTFRDELYLFWLPQPAPIHGFRRHILLRDPRKSPHSECNAAKTKFLYHPKTNSDNQTSSSDQNNNSSDAPQETLDVATDPWGVTVERVELKDVR